MDFLSFIHKTSQSQVKTIWHNPELDVCKTVLLEKHNRILDHVFFSLTLEHAWDLPTNWEYPLLLIKQVYYARPKLML